MAEQRHPRHLLVTGGAGFIGSNFVRLCLATDPAVRIIVVDALTYAGNTANLEEARRLAGDRFRFVHGDIANRPLIDELLRSDVDTVVNFAAESHVDRSIDGPAAFIATNVTGTMVLLESCRAAWKDRNDVLFHQISTDEVYGSLGTSGKFTEETPYDPSSPYSASKAAADHLVRAWHRTFALPVTISNCSNNYGPYQFPEKLIPLMIANALADRSLPVYGDGLNIRDWLYVDDHCRAIMDIIRRGKPGRTYNIGGDSEMTNLAIVHQICDLVDALRPRPSKTSRRDLIRFVADRPGHDRRYAIDAQRIARELSWKPQETLASGLARTVQWYLDHQEWVAAITSGRYRLERLGTA